MKFSAKNVILITGKGTQKQKKEQLEKLKSIPDDEALIVLATGKYAGIEVHYKEELSQNLCVIDEKILWYGSVNYLGFSEKEACCMRISDVKIASEIEGEIIK